MGVVGVGSYFSYARCKRLDLNSNPYSSLIVVPMNEGTIEGCAELCSSQNTMAVNCYSVFGCLCSYPFGVLDFTDWPIYCQSRCLGSSAEISGGGRSKDIQYDYWTIFERV